MFINDCEAEETLFRDTERMNQIVKEAHKATPAKIDENLTSEVVTTYYKENYRQYLHEEPDPDWFIDKKNVVDWARKNPAMRTLDVKLLLQRFFCADRNFEDISKRVRPPKPRPMESTLKNIHYRQARQANRYKRQQLKEQGFTEE